LALEAIGGHPSTLNYGVTNATAAIPRGQRHHFSCCGLPIAYYVPPNAASISIC